MVLQVAAVPGLPILAAGVARQRAIGIRVCRRLAGTSAGRGANTPPGSIGCQSSRAPVSAAMGGTWVQAR
jgi:hypothetical protein